MTTVTQNFTTVAALKAAITTARQDAKAEAQRDCGRGALFSRGAWLRTVDAKGNILQGECDSWAWEGTAKQMKELADLLRYTPAIAEITIQGGWDWAANPRAYADSDYECWVSEWAITFGKREGQVEQLISSN